MQVARFELAMSRWDSGFTDRRRFHSRPHLHMLAEGGRVELRALAGHPWVSNPVASHPSGTFQLGGETRIRTGTTLAGLGRLATCWFHPSPISPSWCRPRDLNPHVHGQRFLRPSRLPASARPAQLWYERRESNPHAVALVSKTSVSSSSTTLAHSKENPALGGVGTRRRQKASVTHPQP